MSVESDTFPTRVDVPELPPAVVPIRPAQARPLSVTDRAAGRVPPHDLEAERALLSACMLKADLLETIAEQLTPEQLYDSGHGIIYAAILGLHAQREPVDVVTVAGVLRRTEKLGQVGGVSYLASVVDATPSVSLPSVEAYARRIADTHRIRQTIAQAQRIAAEGYGDVGDVDTWIGSFRSVIPEGASRGAVAAAWRPLPLELLLTAPEARRWLLRHPTRDGAPAAPGQGDGLLPLGKAGMLSSEGGAGKTMALAQLAVSIVTGHTWLGHYEIGHEARRGKILLALAEEDLEEVHRRLFSVADSLRLSTEQRQRIAERVVVLPLAGQPVALIARGPDGEALVDTVELRALRSLLRRDAGDHGWSLVVLDPLARWAGPDVESDNMAATRFVQAVESLTESPGRPTVLVAHHSSKLSRRTGSADARGVTALTDGFRWAATLRSTGKGVAFQQTKSNYSIPQWDELALARGRGGLLAVPSPEEQAKAEAISEARQDAKAARAEESIAKMIEVIAETVKRAKVGVESRAALVSLVAGNHAIKQAAVSRLMASGRLAKSNGHYVLVEGLDHASD